MAAQSQILTLGTGGIERRRAERVVPGAIACNLGMLIDVSATGAAIESSAFRGWKVGRKKQIKLHRGPEVAGLECECMWRKTKGLFGSTVGIRFSEPSEQVKGWIQETKRAYAQRSSRKLQSPVAA